MQLGILEINTHSGFVRSRTYKTPPQTATQKAVKKPTTTGQSFFSRGGGGGGGGLEIVLWAWRDVFFWGGQRSQGGGVGGRGE
jgi:hypothetical protein